MDPVTIMALVQAGLGLAGAAQKGIAASKQNKMAKEYGKTKRPDFQIAPSLIKATDMARANLNPAINPQELLEVDKDVANTLATAQKIGGASTSDMLAGAIGAQANKYAAKRNLFASNQNRKDAAMGKYMSILGNMAGQENQAFEWNQMQPYLNAQDAAQTLNQSAGQNAGNMLGDLSAGIGGAVNTYATSANQTKQNDMMKQMLGMMYGGETGGALSKYGDNVQSLGQKGLPSINRTAKPELDPKAPYKTTGADLLGLDKDTMLNMLQKQAKIPITNANIPASQRIAEKPVAPVVSTTVEGQTLLNGKPMTKTDYEVNTDDSPMTANVLPKKTTKSQEEQKKSALDYAFKTFGKGAWGKEFGQNMNSALSQYLPMIIKMMQNK